MPTCLACREEIPFDARFCPACGEVAAPSAAATAAHHSEEVTPPPRKPSGDVRFAAGEVLAGRYRIVARLGKGGMGEVYRADDLRLGQSVALKFLPSEWLDDPKSLAGLHEEVRLTRQISHANVCRVYDIAEAHGQSFLSMEYIDGEDLASLLRRIGRLAPDKGLDIARQLCLGLAAAHAQGVIHRDLKPANIMLDGRGHVRIMDFGLARVAESVTGVEARSGTPGYMAPEQLAGKEATVRSDIYALGLVLYELFTGKKVYEGSSPGELMRLQESSTPINPSQHVADVDPVLEQVILRCLALDPTKRPATVLAVSAALPGGDPVANAIARGETPSPEMVAAASDAAGWTPRIALAAFLGLLVALACCLLLYQSGMLVGRVDMRKSPELLTQAAKDILEKKLHVKLSHEYAIGFDHDRDYLDWVSKNDASAERWDRLAERRPAALYFWYRQRDDKEYLVPSLYNPYAGTLEAGRITLDEPAPVMPGMTSVKLDLEGRLLEFHAVPPRQTKTPDVAKTPDWQAFFAAADLVMSQFTSATPEWTPPSFANERKAWTGTLDDAAHTPVRIEAAALHGEPVYFRMIGPWDEGGGSPSGFQGSLDRAGEIMSAILFFAVFAAAVVLAPRSLRQGRADRKGAFRIAIGTFIILMTVWLFETHHVPSIDELRLLIHGLAYSLYWAGLLWITYIALEPYVRQLFPECLITWTRFLSGQWRDPRLGRDLLLGALAGGVFQVVDQAGRILPALLGASTPAPFFDWWVPNSHIRGYWIANFMINLIYSFRWAFFYDLLLFLVLRVVFRRTLPAAVAYLLLSTTLWVGTGATLDPSLYWLFALLTQVLLLCLLLRVGVFAVFVAIFVWYSACFPLTTDWSAWHAQTTLLSLGPVVLLGGYGYYTSLAGRSLFGENKVAR